MTLVIRPGDTEEMIDKAIEMAEEHKWFRITNFGTPVSAPEFLNEKDIEGLQKGDYFVVPEHSIYTTYRFETALKLIRKQQQPKKNGNK